VAPVAGMLDVTDTDACFVEGKLARPLVAQAGRVRLLVLGGKDAFGRVVTIVGGRSCVARMLPCVVPVADAEKSQATAGAKIRSGGAKIRSGIGVLALVGPTRSDVLKGRGVMGLTLLVVAVRSDVLILTGRGGGLGEQRMLPVRTEGSNTVTRRGSGLMVRMLPAVTERSTRGHGGAMQHRRLPEFTTFEGDTLRDRTPIGTASDRCGVVPWEFIQTSDNELRCWDALVTTATMGGGTEGV